MKLRRVRLPGGAGFSVAILHNDEWLPLRPMLELHRARGATAPPELTAASDDIVAFLQGGATLRAQATELLTELLPVLAKNHRAFEPDLLLPFHPLSFRDFMLYERHAIDAARGLVRRFMPRVRPLVAAYERATKRPFPALRPKKLWYERPIYYMGNHLSFLPDGATIPWPSYTKALDYELELGLVIAHPIRDASPEDAVAAIGGFVVVNDFSARDVQYAEMTSGFGPVKAKNFASGLGAVVVTADEILPRVEDLEAEVRVNGKVWGQGHSAGMRYPLWEVVAYASRGEQLLPGELIATGTIPGCSGMEVGKWLSPRDEIELSITGVGTLRNVIGVPKTS
jgi:2-keto-4-pentenoate hydratase/2-oxohepta-3-ene-1,7-dioic acid hydratase in catechol pathway